jgi:hypothetical protein
MEVPFSALWLSTAAARIGAAFLPRGPPFSESCGPSEPQNLPVDGRNPFNHLPPSPVVGDPALCEWDQGGRQRDLLGSTPSQGDGQVGGAMLIAAGASASGLAATKLPNENGATKEFLQWRQLLCRAPSLCSEAVFHAFRLYNRQIRQTQPVTAQNGNPAGRKTTYFIDS